MFPSRFAFQIAREKKMSSKDLSSSYHLVKNPTDLPPGELERINAEGFKCMVPLRDYMNLKKVADKMTATSKALDILLEASLTKRDDIQRSFKELETKFHHLVELRDDALFVSVRELEDGVTKTLRLLEDIRLDFKNEKMSPDQFSEALTLITVTLEECEPDTFLAHIFDEFQLE